MSGDVLPAAGKRKGYEYLRATYRNSETSLMAGYITAQGARDLVALHRKKEEIGPFLDNIHDKIREQAGLGRTSLFFTTAPPEFVEPRHVDGICKVLEAEGFSVVLADHVINIHWE